MIDIALNHVTGVARLSSNTILKPGGDVPVRITFAEAPGTVSSITFALGSDAAPPEVLAYLDTFTEESSTVWTGVLDCNDSRLIDFMDGQSVATINAELSVLVDGEQIICPNIALTVQQRIVTAPAGGVGGPFYPTVITKTTTGNPAAPTGPAFCINTFDNNFKIYAEGAWRTLATW